MSGTPYAVRMGPESRNAAGTNAAISSRQLSWEIFQFLDTLPLKNVQGSDNNIVLDYGCYN